MIASFCLLTARNGCIMLGLFWGSVTRWSPELAAGMIRAFPTSSLGKQRGQGFLRAAEIAAAFDGGFGSGILRSS